MRRHRHHGPHDEGSLRERIRRHHERFHLNDVTAVPAELGRFVRARLHRRLFMTMGVAIFLTIGALAASLYLMQPEDQESPRMADIERFFATEFAESWTDRAQRDRLAERTAVAFRVKLTLLGARGENLGNFRGGCAKPVHELDVRQAGQSLGRVNICAHHFSGGRAQFFIALFVAAFVLWMIAGGIARKMSRPLWELVLVTRELGEGKLSSRARLGRHQAGEVGILAHSINEMASRIEKQIADQKELLAGVSHEIRTPLARLRVLKELLEGEGADAKRLEQIEREILEIDDLTGKLLASSRLDFEALDRKELDPRALAEECLQRARLDRGLLVVAGDPPVFQGDATLLGRALVNLIGNAAGHGGGIVRFTVERVLVNEEEFVRFAVEDDGPGFNAGEVERVFDSFYRGRNAGESGGSLGLGLSLVRRIARAHGGDAFAKNKEDRGACVGFTVRVRPPAAS